MFSQVNVSDVIILEGILVFHDQRVRNLMNMKIFVDTGITPYLIVISVIIISWYPFGSLSWKLFCDIYLIREWVI